jgi:hypothetical protein
VRARVCLCVVRSSVCILVGVRSVKGQHCGRSVQVRFASNFLQRLALFSLYAALLLSSCSESRFSTSCFSMGQSAGCSKARLLILTAVAVVPLLWTRDLEFLERKEFLKQRVRRPIGATPVASWPEEFAS